MKLVECVPNFSEGRNEDIVNQIIDAIRGIPGVTLLDKEMDPDHNRSVITLVGKPDDVVEAAFSAVKKATELIDLKKHKGEHPRIGATDVIPFVPVRDVEMSECVELAERLGKRIADELNIPVYLYGEAARVKEREDLAYIRKGEFEGLRESIKEDPSKKPDFGPSELHPSAGAIAVGARKFLIAYNVNLGSSDIKIAKQIAKRIRAKGGGLSAVKALGFELKDRGIVQVSMNLVDYEKSSIYEAYELVKLFADRYGVPIIGSEIVGLVPQKALIDVADFYLRLENFQPDQTVEAKLEETDPVESWVMSLASSSPTPGGGSASALSLSQGYALLSMVGELTLKSKRYEENWVKIQAILPQLKEGVRMGISLVTKDTQAFQEVMSAFGLPKDTDDDKKKRKDAIQKALVEAAEVPLEVMENSFEGLGYVNTLIEYGNKNALSDVGCAIAQFYSAFLGAKYNVLINLGGIKDEKYVSTMEERIKDIEKQFEETFKKLKIKLEEDIK